MRYGSEHGELTVTGSKCHGPKIETVWTKTRMEVTPWTKFEIDQKLTAKHGPKRRASKNHVKRERGDKESAKGEILRLAPRPRSRGCIEEEGKGMLSNNL